MAFNAPRFGGSGRTGDSAGRPSAPHGEWLLDQAIMETFPASDPVAPFDDHDAATARAAGAHRPLQTISLGGLAWAAAACAAVLLACRASRRSR